MKTFHYQFQKEYNMVKDRWKRQWHHVSTLLWVTTQSSHWLLSPLKTQPLHPTPLVPALLPYHQLCLPRLAKIRPLLVNFSRDGGELSMWSSLALRWLSFWAIIHEKALELHKLVSWFAPCGQCPLDLIFSRCPPGFDLLWKDPWRQFAQVDTLEIHLRETADFVDHYFLVEATRTHKGDKKPILWERLK